MLLTIVLTNMQIAGSIFPAEYDDLGGSKRATLRMKSRDWNEQAAKFVNTAYEIGVEPGDIQLQLTVLGYNLEISIP